MSHRRPIASALALLVASLATGCGSGSEGTPTRPETPAPAAEPAADPPAEEKMAKEKLSDEALIAKAREAAKGIEFSPNAGAPQIERDGDKCTVRFPIDYPKDMPALGPDYDAEVDLDCATGEVAAVRVGS